MQTALSTISPLPATREQVQLFVRSLKNEILDGKRDPLPILVQLTCIERMIKDILSDEDIERHFLREFDLYGKEKVVSINGAKLQEQEVGIKIDYNSSGDPVWMKLDKEIKDLTEKRKQREKFLQNIPYESEFVDPDTGVYVTRPTRTSTTKVVVKLP